MLLLTILLAFIAIWFAHKEYMQGQIRMAMFWAGLLGWDLHSLLLYI